MVPMTTFVDLCVRLGEDPTVLLRRALQRAGIAPDKMTLEVDLLALLRDEFDPLFLHPWAKGRLSESRGGLIQLSPEDVKSLARDFHPRHTVAGYLARYYPTGTARN